MSPQIIVNVEGHYLSEYLDGNDQSRPVRLLTWLPGRVWSDVNPINDALLSSLGDKAGSLTISLQSFKHPYAEKYFEWDIAQSLWVEDYIHHFSDDQQEIAKYFINRFKTSKSSYDQLSKSIVHNDVNDNNVIVSDALINPEVISIIDYGDAIHTQVINDVAITCAYAMMGFNDPLAVCLPIVKAYHAHNNLSEEDLSHLYNGIAMRLLLSVTKSAINKINFPENKYLQVSEKPAWNLLKKWRAVSADFAEYSFRTACGYSPHPNNERFNEWSQSVKLNMSQLFPELGLDLCQHLDLNVESTWLGHYDDIDNIDLFDYKIAQFCKKHHGKIPAGGYMETRPLYSSDDYDTEANAGKVSRTVHMGIDFWLPAGTAVHALFDGEIYMASNDNGAKGYGGLIVLKHLEDGIVFYTLYGHLSLSSLNGKDVGQRIKCGKCIGYLGTPEENGSWSPHLHFQLLLSTLDFTADFPGVAYQTELDVWKGICPDPNLLFKQESLTQKDVSGIHELMDFRKIHLGKSLSLQYEQPLKIVRGKGVYLVDNLGDKYLDTVNNVAHVGHEHIKVVRAGQEQSALLNTNSRYLHENINELASKLLSTLPEELNVIHFVNSGSEANELAIRIAKAATAQNDIIVSEVGYHGNSNLCVDISSYKFDGKGGRGCPDFVHVVPLVDSFRGKYRGTDSSSEYIKEVERLVRFIVDNGRKPAALIFESIISCGGQIELPVGFLKSAYKLVRDAGGVCIADEVQTGCGRVGKTFWGFELHDIVPDIVTIGKPLGNGHPVAAVVCTSELADKFANGMEYFNTFGGNPVSCAIASAVLDVVNEESLQENARIVGDYLKHKLVELSKSFPIIGDVRGQGLFLGFELVDESLNPLAKHASYLVNRMKYYKILMSTDGKDDNVIKIKPPMVFSKKNVDHLLKYLKKVFAEDFMLRY
jgi:4-aminobutyrate aminotransferase-like enzyme/Ser/Thr protein kinase RdoA (MazF antagonist)